jgi:hypothetical protein
MFRENAVGFWGFLDLIQTAVPVREIDSMNLLVRSTGKLHAWERVVELFY